MAAGHASKDGLSIVLKDTWRWNTKHLDYTEYSLFSHCFDRKIIKRCKWFGLSWIYEVRYLLLINNYLEKNGQIHSVKSILICDSAEVTAQKKRRWKKAREKSRELSLAPDWITFSCLVILKHRNHSKYTFLFSSHSLSLVNNSYAHFATTSKILWSQLVCPQTLCFVLSMWRPHAKLLTAGHLKKLELKWVSVGKDYYSRALALHAFSRACAPLALSKKKRVGKTNHLWTD